AHPFTAMCAYDRALGQQAIAELACLHPRARAGATSFHLYAVPDGVALYGELDLASRSLLPHALANVDLVPSGGEIVVDARGIRFIDHRSLIALAEHVRPRGATLVFRTHWAGAERLVELLNLDGVRVVLEP
ncbi:MAG TPA: STAS domain-containing protein, partial [Micromonosporaceae bacterium]|nr:STAS domain-containing protein [Micromonosporaceae bacterium]